jgi:hypothetical protein
LNDFGFLCSTEKNGSKEKPVDDTQDVPDDFDLLAEKVSIK